MWCNVILIKLFNRCDARLKQQRSKLVRVAYSWCHQRALADDLVQETLARAMEKCGQLRDPAQLEPWLFAILTNCWRDYLRRLRPRRGSADRGRARGTLRPSWSSGRTRRSTWCRGSGCSCSGSARRPSSRTGRTCCRTRCPGAAQHPRYAAIHPSRWKLVCVL